MIRRLQLTAVAIKTILHFTLGYPEKQREKKNNQLATIYHISEDQNSKLFTITILISTLQIGFPFSMEETLKNEFIRSMF